jgi:ubiquinone/menaquinone biosynthesis C-methylase UbiE
MFRDTIAETFASPSPGVAMDIGCGTGAGLLPMAHEFTHVVGLDVRMSSLIVAKKLIENHGISNVTLIQGSALCMPFPSSLFDYVTAINVLEHIFEPAAMMEEVHRILAKGGAFVGDSRNRFDLFFPEPHARLRWIGFLPRKWMPRYVRWRRGISYETTHLLSYGDLRRTMTATFRPKEWEIVIPRISTYGFPKWLESLVVTGTECGFLRGLLIRLSPTHLALAHRSD